MKLVPHEERLHVLDEDDPEDERAAEEGKLGVAERALEVEVEDFAETRTHPCLGVCGEPSDETEDHQHAHHLEDASDEEESHEADEVHAPAGLEGTPQGLQNERENHGDGGGGAITRLTCGRGPYQQERRACFTRRGGLREARGMRVLVEILHPAHVHFFRNAIAEWRARGDEVLVLSREKDVANELLDAYGIPYESISRLGGSSLALAGEMIVRDVRMWRRARAFRPNVLVGIMGVTIAQIGRMIRKPAIVFYDTENARLTNSFVYPLAHSVCTPECYAAPVRGRHVTYPGYHELAYLHPNRFTPDAEVVRRAGLDPEGGYFIVRFVSWQASHDFFDHGFDLSLKRAVVQELERHGRVLISCEGALPTDLEPYRLKAPVESIHHIIAFSRMLVGESATMASEAAVLGVPAFYIADTSRGYIDDLESRYGLVRKYKRAEASSALEEIKRIVRDETAREEVAGARRRLLTERVDTTSWVMSYVDRVVGPRAARTADTSETGHD